MPSPLERSRDVHKHGGTSSASVSPAALVSTPEVLSGHLSMTSPFSGVMMAAGPLLFPHPVFYPPLLSLSDLASCRDLGAALPEVARQWNRGGVDSVSGNGSASCDDDGDCDDDDPTRAVTSALPLDLSPPRAETNDSRLHGKTRQIQ